MIFVQEIWCIADVSSVGSSSEQTSISQSINQSISQSFNLVT